MGGSYEKRFDHFYQSAPQQQLSGLGRPVRQGRPGGRAPRGAGVSAGQGHPFLSGLPGLPECVIKDDSHDIVQKMHDADVIVFATPIYYYEMAGQMKTLLDRANWLYSSDYRFGDIYLLTSAAEDDPETPEGAEHGLNGWIACFERARLAGTVFAGGVNGAGEIAGHKALQEAYEMGKKV